MQPPAFRRADRLLRGCGDRPIFNRCSADVQTFYMTTRFRHVTSIATTHASAQAVSTSLPIIPSIGLPRVGGWTRARNIAVKRRITAVGALGLTRACHLLDLDPPLAARITKSDHRGLRATPGRPSPRGDKSAIDSPARPQNGGPKTHRPAPAPTSPTVVSPGEPLSLVLAFRQSGNLGPRSHRA